MRPHKTLSGCPQPRAPGTLSAYITQNVEENEHGEHVPERCGKVCDDPQGAVVDAAMQEWVVVHRAVRHTGCPGLHSDHLVSAGSLYGHYI